jgi:hypothetical protein
VLLTLFPAASSYGQQIHVVPLKELHEKVVSASQNRTEMVSRLERFFTGSQAAGALQSVHLNGQQIRQAIATLSDEDLARLNARAEKATDDFAAGALTNQELTYIVIALATAVLVLIIVKA